MAFNKKHWPIVLMLSVLLEILIWSNYHTPDTYIISVGKLNISGQVMPQEIFNASSIKMVQAGGMYSPECKERESVAIIIPYRLGLLLNSVILMQKGILYTFCKSK